MFVVAVVLGMTVQQFSNIGQTSVCFLHYQRFVSKQDLNSNHKTPRQSKDAASHSIICMGSRGVIQLTCYRLDTTPTVVADKFFLGMSAMREGRRRKLHRKVVVINLLTVPLFRNKTRIVRSLLATARASVEMVASRSFSLF